MAGALFGSSALASPAELKAAGLLGPTGVRLGIVTERSWLGRETPATLRYQGDHHHLIVAGSGGGKFVSSLGLVLFDFLDQRTGSCIIIDPKGEALEKVGKLAIRPFDLHREGEDFTVCWLDPWDLSGTGTTRSYNFLSVLRAASPNLADDARALADAIIIPGSTTETHWDDSAKILLAGILIYVAIHPEEQRRDLTRVCEIVMLPWEARRPEVETLGTILGRMATMDDPSTFANSVGWQYAGMPEKERESILSVARRDCVWIKSPPMWRVLHDDGNALDLKKVAVDRFMVFIVLPFERIRTHRAWLRLLATALADTFRRVPVPDGFASRRHVFVDEWPRLGRLEIFQDEIAVARGANVQYHFYCQSFGQIEENYKNGWEDFVANSLVQAFAIQDKKTSEYLSALAGTQTVENPSWSRPSSLFKGGGTQSYSFTGRAVQMPDEIRRMENAQLVIARGVNPIFADVERVYLSPRFRKGVGFTLADVLATRGRVPKDGRERAQFSWWETDLS